MPTPKMGKGIVYDVQGTNANALPLVGTYAYWDNLRSLSLLPVGFYIKITATSNTDYGIIAKVITPNTITTECIGGFLNADYISGGDYSGITVNNTGIVYRTSDSGTYVLNDVVIYNNLHYRLTGTPGVDVQTPNNLPSKYTLLTKASHIAGTLVGYVEEWDKIIYHFESNTILWRKDKRGNVINGSSLAMFQWGDDNIQSVTQFALNSTINVLNNTGTITGADFGISTSVSFPNNSGTIYYTINSINAQVIVENNSGSLEVNINGFGNGCYGNGNEGNVILYLYNNSYVTFENNLGTIISRHYDQSITDFSDNEGDITHVEISRGSNVTISLANGYSHSYNKYAYSGNSVTFVNGITFPSNKNYFNKETSQASSNFDVELDLDNPAIFSAGVLTVPNYAGVVTLIGGAGPYTITNALVSLNSVTFRKNMSSSVTFNHNVLLLGNSGGANRVLAVNQSEFITYVKPPDVNVLLESQYLTYTP